MEKVVDIPHRWDVAVRKATVEDLPAIHDLIVQSFEAMVPHSWFLWFFPNYWRDAANGLITTELSKENFENVYFTNGNFFWVAEAIDKPQPFKVIGCIGIKILDVPNNGENIPKTAELVRMSVDSSYRGGGVGKYLLNHLLAHAKAQNVKRIVLDTANPESVKFYSRCGFTIIPHWMYWSAEYNITDEVNEDIGK